MDRRKLHWKTTTRCLKHWRSVLVCDSLPERDFRTGKCRRGRIRICVRGGSRITTFIRLPNGCATERQYTRGYAVGEGFGRNAGASRVPHVLSRRSSNPAKSLPGVPSRGGDGSDAAGHLSRDAAVGEGDPGGHANAQDAAVVCRSVLREVRE